MKNSITNYLIICILFIAYNTHAMEAPTTDLLQLAREIEQLYGYGDHIGAINKFREQPAALMRHVIQHDQVMVDLVNHLLDFNFAHDLKYELTEQDYKEMGKLPEVRDGKLNLSQRLLTKIVKHLPHNISDLNLHHNQLQHLPANVLLEHLASLDVSRNKITQISFASLRNLRHLNLRQNEVSSLDQGSLPNSLMSLNLSYNGMQKQPDLRKLPSLKDLDLSYNPISSFDEKLVPQTITTLHLHNLEQLSELIIRQLPNLENFWASNAQHLKKIVITDSKIRKIRLKNIPVETLILSNNRLEDMVDDLFPQSVVTLSLANNPIARVLLNNLINLRMLSLEQANVSDYTKLYWYSKMSGRKLVDDFKDGNFRGVLNNPLTVFSAQVAKDTLVLYCMYRAWQAERSHNQG